MSGEARPLVLPVPWTVTSPSTDAHAFDVVAANGLMVHKGFWGGEGDAHLIAAAPDLLAACKAVLACECQHDERGHAFLRINARSLHDLAAEIAAVVAKAEGRDA